MWQRTSSLFPDLAYDAFSRQPRSKFSASSFPALVGGRGKHVNEARFSGQKSLTVGTLVRFSFVPYHRFYYFYPSILWQALELVMALRQHAQRIPLLRMASFPTLICLRWIFLIGLQPNLKVTQRVLFIARQSLLLRTEVILSVIKVFPDVEIADSSDSKTHDKVDFSSKPLRQAMNRGSFELRRTSGRLKNLINCKNSLMRTPLQMKKALNCK